LDWASAADPHKEHLMDTRQKLRDIAVSESGFIFDPYSGVTFTVNETGRRILDALKRGLDRDGVLADLDEAFEQASSADLDRDLEEFVQMLRHHGLVPKDFELA